MVGESSCAIASVLVLVSSPLTVEVREEPVFHRSITMDRAKLALVGAAVVGTSSVLYFGWRWWSWRRQLRPPTKWHRVGELCEIACYPIKSLGPIKVESMECTNLGLKSGWLRDRTLMVVNLEGEFVTARQHPRMLQIMPSMSGPVLTLKGNGMMNVSVDLSQLKEQSQAVVWGQAVPACDCGEEVAKWLSRFLLQEETGFRLAYYPLDRPVRTPKGIQRPFPFIKKEDAGAFPDETSYSLENEASIEDLNSRLEQPTRPLQFRPNFVVRGPKAYEEDTWDWIKIGNVVFRNIRPAARCILTTIDSESGTKHPNFEPLKTLRTYRAFADPEVRSFVRSGPALDIHLGLRSAEDVIRVGDPVYIGESDVAVPPLVLPPKLE